MDRREFLEAAREKIVPLLGLGALASMGAYSPSKSLSRGPRLPFRQMGAGPITEIPTVDLARVFREWNWGGGSCVHASTVMDFRWLNELKLADYWRKTYSGGESYNGLNSKLNRNNIRWYSSYSNQPGPPNDVAALCSELCGAYDRHNINYRATKGGDPKVLDQCIRERRGAIIFYKPNHSILLVHMDAQNAIVLDNNAINQFEVIPRARFIPAWQGYGGVAIVPLVGAPRSPLPWINA